MHCHSTTQKRDQLQASVREHTAAMALKWLMARQKLRK